MVLQQPKFAVFEWGCESDFRFVNDFPKIEKMNVNMKIWLPDMDLNHDKQIQSLLCYRYTIGQAGACRSVNLSIRVSSY